MSVELYPYKILFIEDEKVTRENYVIYLQTLFREVYAAADGEEGYDLYKVKKPDIMIVDINLPKMNGLELLKKIRQSDQNTKAIMLTAHTDKTFLLEAASLKLTKYLVKPVNRKDLKKALQETIDELLTYGTFTLRKIELADHYSWNIERKELFYYNNVVELTSKEKKLLELLFSKQNKIFSYNEIFEYFWEDDTFTLNSLKNIVKRVRKKLPADTIINVFNEGYKINF